MTIALVEPQTTDLADQTVEELAERANRSLAAMHNAASAALDSAIEAGQALEEIAQRLSHGEWLPWIAANFHGSHTLAYHLRKCARYADELREHDFKSLTAAKRFLTEGGYSLTARRVLTEDEVEEIRRLLDSGRTQDEIAGLYGVSQGCISRVVSPARIAQVAARAKRSQVRRQAALKALRRHERDQEMKRKSGGLSKSYEHIRALTKLLDDELAAHTGEARAAIDAALHWAYRVEDQIVRASRAT